MVYCGKPSRGCQMCRTRRIKCDETKPTCLKCAKSRRVCPGYKDEFDLVFRNETQSTELKARKASRKASAQKMDQQVSGQSSSPSGTPSSALPDGVKSSLGQAVVPALNQPVEQRASCFFVSNFVLVPKPEDPRGFYDYLVPLLNQEGPGSHLEHAFNACSLALFYNRRGPSTNLSERALNEYAKALSKTNAALRDAEAQKADSTLAAVLLLGTFENITGKQIAIEAWGSHVEGAIQLVKIRGRRQLRTGIGLLLFIAVRTQMIMHTFSFGKSPSMGAQWWLEGAVKNQTASECQRVAIKAGELLDEVRRYMTVLQRTPENIEIVLEVIRRCQTVDQEAVSWMNSLPEHWQYKTVAWENHVPNNDYSKAEVFPGRVDVYADAYIASVWNMVRTTRLILHIMIVRCAAWVCAPVDYRTTPEYATAARICVEISTDIIASAPPQLGWRPKRGDAVQRVQLGGFACGEEDSTKAFAGYSLAPSLVCVIGQDYTTDAQRTWLIGRLRYIGDELGVKYAHVLTERKLRFPSALIRYDGLQASMSSTGQSFGDLISARLAAPTGFSPKSLTSQREAAPEEEQHADRTRAQLLAKALTSGDASQSVQQYMAQKWLTA
ncbi:hypothetical protein DL770_001314 [Monosporascus sp. CRB-9-2]|nr:hypothetical protein DL770_001314 [Monosporascus sp. CRB-9-2]